jgi:hypothetical protein
MCNVLLPPGVNKMCTVLLPPGVNQMCIILLPPGVNQMCTVLLPPGVNPIAVKNKKQKNYNLLSAITQNLQLTCPFCHPLSYTFVSAP